jgi:UDP-2-acetamido-3-amino-2,3-dideoxy-glucuronate N-acetyltransferase
MQSETFIHPSAIIDDGARIGQGTYVWHFTHIMPKATIGSNCNLGQNVFIDNDVNIGNGVKIQNNVSVYKGVIIEDDVFLGPSAVFTNVINPRSFISRKSEFKSILVRKGATIGANATIVCGVEIGQYALVGAGSVVTKNVPPFAIFYGNPARQKGWVSRAGYKLIFNEKSEAICPSSGEKYLLREGGVIILNN